MVLKATTKFVVESSKYFGEDSGFTAETLDAALTRVDTEFVYMFKQMFGNGEPGVSVTVEHEHVVEEV